MPNFTSPVVTIRPALPRDQADVTEFTRFIWEGHDYVGEVFQEWLNDPQGILLAAEYAGHCVGCAKVTLLSPGQWWLEGFRVDPKYQDHRIGSKLDAASNEWWDKHGDGVVRLMTSSQRVKVHHLSEARGFRKLGEVAAYESEPMAEPTEAFTLLALEDVEEALEFCRRAAPGRMMDMGWRFVTPNHDSLRAVARDGLAYWWRGRTGFLSAWDDEFEGGIRFVAGLEACAEAERAELLMDVRRLASARGAVTAGWMGILNETIIQNLTVAGYAQEWDNIAFLYERRP